MMSSLRQYRSLRPAAIGTGLFGIFALGASTAGALIADAGNGGSLFASYLLAYVFWLNVALGCLGLLMLHHTVGGRWGVPIRRMLEAGTATLPLLLVLFVPLLFGLRELYPWARPEAAAAAVLQHKRSYLNVPFFAVRMGLCFAIWMVLAALLRRFSLAQDKAKNRPDRIEHARAAEWLERLSAPGLVLYVVTVSFALWDLTATLDPHWYSTLYGLLMIDVQALAALAFVVLVLLMLSSQPPLKDAASRDHLHDLGNLLLMLVLLWAYLSFMQLLISWSGNLPNEVRYYLPRLRGSFGHIAVCLVVFHFALPLVGLLSRSLKRSRGALGALALLLLGTAWLDLFWLVAPGFGRQGATAFRWLDFIILAGTGGLFLSFYLIRLGARPLLALGAAHVHERAE